GQDAQKVSAREEQKVALNRADSLQEAVGSGAHLPRGFTPGATVAKKPPVGPLRMNLNAAAAFVLTIVPFEQVRFDLGQSSKTSQFAGPGRALQGAGQNFRKGLRI